MTGPTTGTLLDSTHKTFLRFPPRWQNVLVPCGGSRAAALGMTLYAASKPAPLVAHYALWAVARLSTGRVLPPGRRETWAAPVPQDVLAALCGQWSEAVGGAGDGIAVYERLQAARTAMTVLVCAGARSMLVRVREDPAELVRERSVSVAAQGRPRSAFAVPALVGEGEAGGWHWTGYAVMSTRPHRPLYRLPRHAGARISDLVEAAVPRPPGTPTHWRGAHCDVTPWNLRRGGGRTWLIDWEEAAWAPPGTDQLYLRATVAAMGRRPIRPDSVPAADEEARTFCVELLEQRSASSREDHLRKRMLRALGAAPPG